MAVAAVAAVHVAHAQAPSQAEIGAIKAAIELVENGKGAEALNAAAGFKDQAGQKLITWLALRTDWRAVGFVRANAFLRENADWPSTTSLLRRRAESLLYEEKRDSKTVRSFFANTAPLSGEGKLALARALLAGGDRVGALPLVKSAWHDDDLTPSIEQETLSTFQGMLGRDDHKIRADKFFFARNRAAAMRAAERAGSDVVALERARVATSNRAGNANTLINAVPAALRSDPGLIYARLQFRWRNNDHPGAAEILLTKPRDPKLLVDTDNWWREVRIVVRGLLDRGDPKTAYRIAVHSGLPDNVNFKADQQFTAGWIALRFLNDPKTAAKHFALLEQASDHPITQARAFYWQGRTFEALGDKNAAKAAFS